MGAISNTFSPINPATANAGVAGLASKLQIGANGGLQASPSYTASQLGIKQTPAQVNAQPSTKLKNAPVAPLMTAPVPAPSQSVKGLLSVPATAPSVPATPYSDTGKSFGTQHPGDAGFNPSYPKANTNVNQAEYDSTGKYIGSSNFMPQAYTSTASGPNTFPGIVGGLSTAAQNGSPQAQAYTAQTAQYGAGNIPIGQEAADIAKQYGQQIADVGNKGAQFASGQLTTGTSPVAEGNAAVTAQTTAAEQQALATGEGAALQGIGYQLTGQNQAANASNEAAGQATTAQGQTITGLASAGNLAQPQLGQPGQAYYNPQSGTAVGQTGGAPAGIDPSVWNQYIQDYATGQFNAIPGSITGNAQLYGQLQAAVTAQNPSFNYNTAAGQAQGAQALGAAPGTTQAGVYGTQQSQVAQYTSALQQGQNLQSQLSDLIQSFGLNPNDLNAANIGIQKIAQNVSSPQYKILQNYVNDVANTYSQILTPPGGSATDTTRGIASSMLDATASGQSLITVMKSLDQAAQAKIAGIPTTGAGAAGTTGSKGTIVQTKAGAVNTDW